MLDIFVGNFFSIWQMLPVHNLLSAKNEKVKSEQSCYGLIVRSS